MVAVEEPDGLDGPGSFTAAAEAFVDWCPQPITVHRAAKTLSELAKAGLLVSVDQHESALDECAVMLLHVQAAADELVARLHAGDPEPGA